MGVNEPNTNILLYLLFAFYPNLMYRYSGNNRKEFFNNWMGVVLKNKVEVNMTKLTISVRNHIKLSDIANLLDSASRGASYWADSKKLGYDSYVKSILEQEEDLEIQDFEDSENNKPKTYILNLKKIKRGLTVMAKKEPLHFADFIKGDFDQTTGDIFLQYCLFGEVIYS